MTTFHFRLERVLRARRVAEEVQRARLFEAETAARALDDAAQASTVASASSCDVLRADQSATTLDASRVLVAQSAHERVLAAELAARRRATEGRLAATTERVAWTSRRSDVRAARSANAAASTQSTRAGAHHGSGNAAGAANATRTPAPTASPTVRRSAVGPGYRRTRTARAAATRRSATGSCQPNTLSGRSSACQAGKPRAAVHPPAKTA